MLLRILYFVQNFSRFVHPFEKPQQDCYDALIFEMFVRYTLSLAFVSLIFMVVPWKGIGI